MCDNEVLDDRLAVPLAYLQNEAIDRVIGILIVVRDNACECDVQVAFQVFAVAARSSVGDEFDLEVTAPKNHLMVDWHGIISQGLCTALVGDTAKNASIPHSTSSGKARATTWIAGHWRT